MLDGEALSKKSRVHPRRISLQQQYTTSSSNSCQNRPQQQETLDVKGQKIGAENGKIVQNKSEIANNSERGQQQKTPKKTFVSPRGQRFILVTRKSSASGQNVSPPKEEEFVALNYIRNTGGAISTVDGKR